MESFRKDALLGKELKYLEEQSIIDNARIRNFRSPKIKGKIDTVKESTANLSKEIDDYTAEMNDDEYNQYRRSKIISKQQIKEPVEFSLLRNSIVAALSSASDDYDEIEFEEEEEENYSTEASEVAVSIGGEKDYQKIHSPITKNMHTPKSKTFSMTNFYQTSNSRLNLDPNSRSMRYEDLMSSFESPLNPPETNRAIEIADKVRVKLYSPFMSKRNIEPTLPQNLSMASIYRTPQNSKSIKNSRTNTTHNIKSNNYSSRLTSQLSPFFGSRKAVTDINGVTEHVQRLRRAKQVTPVKKNTDDFDNFREVIVPDMPIITPNRTKITNLFTKEIDKVLQEVEHSIIEQDNFS